MVIRQVSRADVEKESLRVLGLDPALFNTAMPEVLAAAVRRAAAFLCPCTRPVLRSAVFESLKTIDAALEGDSIEEAIEGLIVYGDLHEFQSSDTVNPQFEVFSAPPAYVTRTSGPVFLLGSVPDRPSVLPPEFERRIQHTGYLRRLDPYEGENLRVELERLGLREIPLAQWTKAPSEEAASLYVSRYNARLANAGRSGEIEGLTVLNPETSVAFYRRRWQEPRGLTGRFIGRRPQRFGAMLWCYVELSAGAPQRMLDLPIFETGGEAYDEAWRLQAAIDAQRGHPQQCGVGTGQQPGMSLMSFFAPIPRWAQRRLDAVGTRAEMPGTLFAYCLPDRDCSEEVRFLEKTLWLRRHENPRGRDS